MKSFHGIPFTCFGLLLAASAVSHGVAEDSRPGSPIKITHQRTIDLDDGHLQWVAISPDGKTVAACGDHWVQIYDVRTGKRVQKLGGHKKDIVRFAFSPNGKWIASASRDQTVRIWDVATGKTIEVLRGHTDAIFGVAFSPDGKWVASASANDDGTIRIWEKGTWKERMRTRAPRGTNAMFVAFSPDGKLLATGEYRGGVRLYELGEDKLRLRFSRKHDGGEMTPHVTFSPDGRALVSSSWDRTARAWDVKTGKQLWKAKAPRGARCFETSVFSPDGARVYSVTRDETIEVRNASNGKLITSFQGRDSAVRGLAMAPDESFLATAGHNRAIKLWKVQRK